MDANEMDANEIEECIFCKIARKDIVSSVIYENEHVICFLDINPSSRGHCLVVPKKHYQNIFDIASIELNEIIQAAKRISEKARKNLNATGVNIVHASGKDAQQSVFHFHLHVIPRYVDDKIDAGLKSTYSEADIESVKADYDKILL
jgi:histidine triad (HIT) family protein